jgi:hypothetical protein
MEGEGERQRLSRGGVVGKAETSCSVAREAACAEGNIHPVRAVKEGGGMAGSTYREGEEVKDLCAVPPCIGISIFPLTFIIKPIHLR